MQQTTSVSSSATAISSESLSVLFFGTNQYTQPSQEIVHRFYLAQGVENFDHSKERKIFFNYRQGSSNKVVQVKCIFLNILDQEYAICKSADAYVIFIDLEAIDSLDKLSNIIAYIKDKCRSIITTHVIGKYNSSEGKIKSLHYANMIDYLKEKTFGFTYTEMCCESNEEVIEEIRVLLQNAGESKERIRNNKEAKPKKQRNGLSAKSSEEDESNRNDNRRLRGLSDPYRVNRVYYR